MIKKFRACSIAIAVAASIVGIFLIFFVMIFQSWTASVISTQAAAEKISAAVERYGKEYLELYSDSKNIGISVRDSNRQYTTTYGYSEFRRTDIFTGHINHFVTLSDGNVLRFVFVQDTIFSKIFQIMYPTIIYAIFLIALLWYLYSGLFFGMVEKILSINLKKPLESTELLPELLPLLKKVDTRNRYIYASRQSLQLHRNELQYVMDCVLDAIVIFDSSMHIVQANKRAKELLHCDEGKYYLDFHREYTYRTTLENAIKHGRATSEVVLRGLPMHMYAYLIKLEGMENRLFVFLSDESDTERAGQLRREFSANVSHELKTPLTSIMGNAELLCSGLVKNEDKQGFYEKIYAQSQRLLQLVEDIIKLSRLDEGVAVSWERLDVFNIAKEVNLQLLEKAKKNNVSINLTGDSVNIEGLPTVVFEIIYNLCDNAIVYNKAGGRVDIKIYSEAVYAVIVVSDTGIGIAEADIPHIFERFYRADKSHSNLKVAGTGLGLSIVKHAVRMHGGEVSVKSEPYNGSLFTVKLPLSRR